MKKIISGLVLLVWFFCLGSLSAQTATPTAISISSPVPAVAVTPHTTVQWETYTNLKYGFSIQYPLVDIPEPRPVDRQNIYDESEIDVPSLYTGDTGLIIRNITDASVAKWNKFMEKNGYDDMEPFPYSMKDLYDAIRLPVGNTCTQFQYGKVVMLNGIKALRIVDVATLYPGISYFIYRGGTRWLEIDEYLEYADKEQLIGEKEFVPKAKAEMAAHEAVLKTLKLFDPN